MKPINHFTANSEFKFQYYKLEENFRELEAFLRDIHKYVSDSEKKMAQDVRIHSIEFCDLFYVASYGETFRSSFIIAITSVSETFIKGYCKIWDKLLHDTNSLYKPTNSLFDSLKEFDKTYMQLPINFSKKEVLDFRGLMAVRNSLVHSDGNLEYVSKNAPIIQQLTKDFPSIRLDSNGFLHTEERFCWDTLSIAKRFFFYIFKLAIKRFANYKEDRPDDESEIKFKA